MSFDEGNLLRDQSSHVDTVTNTSEANDQGHTEPGCSNKKPAGTSLIYQALFLHGETTQSQVSEDEANIRGSHCGSVSWTNQSQAPSTGAGSQGWSSFSDISNAISPAASCDSVDVSWKESETEADLLTSRGNPETDCSLNVPLTSVSTVKYQFDPATARVLQNVPTPSTEGDQLGYSELDGGYSDLKGNTSDFAVANQDPPVLDQAPHVPVRGIQVVQETLGTYQELSTECFEAAVKEKLKTDLRGKIISKLRQSKSERRCQYSYSTALKLHDHHQQQEQEHQQQSQSYHPEKLSPHIPQSRLLSHDLHSPVSSTQSGLSLPTFVHSSVHCGSSSSMSVYVSPESPSITSPSSGEQSDGSSKKSYSKKYRYSQTAAALQKSGLFNATMKTAELLQRNQVLQQELQKLRRESMIFVHSVLANPENEHLRKMYMHHNQGIK